MGKILFIAATEANGKLSPGARKGLGAALELKQMLNGELYIGLWGKSTEEAAQLPAADQISKGYFVEGEAFAESRYATDAAACEAICRQVGADIVVAPDNARTNRILAGVAQRLNGIIDSHITEFKVENDALMVSRWHYRQRLLAQISRTQRPWFLSIESGVFKAPEAGDATVALEKIAVEVSDRQTRTVVKGVEAPSVDEQTIRPDAELLFVAGAGWTKKQPDGDIKADLAADLIFDFLKNSKASLGSTKSLVDLSSEGAAVLPFMTQLNQVGQTGSTPRHDKGLATCCHGEEPHVVGWRFVNERRAINLDANCGWAHGKADVLYVADAFKVIHKVNELLANQQ